MLRNPSRCSVAVQLGAQHPVPLRIDRVQRVCWTVSAARSRRIFVVDGQPTKQWEGEMTMVDGTSDDRRVAIVTGAAGALGSAMCERFVHDGIRVVVADVAIEPAR